MEWQPSSRNLLQGLSHLIPAFLALTLDLRGALVAFRENFGNHFKGLRSPGRD